MFPQGELLIGIKCDCSLTQWDGTWILTESAWDLPLLDAYYFDTFSYIFCYLQAKCSFLVQKVTEAMWLAYSQLTVSCQWWLRGKTLVSMVLISVIALYPQVTLLGPHLLQPGRHPRGWPRDLSYRSSRPVPKPQPTKKSPRYYK